MGIQVCVRCGSEAMPINQCFSYDEIQRPLPDFPSQATPFNHKGKMKQYPQPSCYWFG